MTSEKVYVVDGIIDDAIIDGERRWRVHWEGYPSDQDTWEPESQVSHLPYWIAYENNRRLNEIVPLDNVPSDDSNDEDYDGESDYTPSTNSKRRKTRKKSRKKKKHRHRTTKSKRKKSMKIKKKSTRISVDSIPRLFTKSRSKLSSKSNSNSRRSRTAIKNGSRPRRLNHTQNTNTKTRLNHHDSSNSIFSSNSPTSNDQESPSTEEQNSDQKEEKYRIPKHTQLSISLKERMSNYLKPKAVILGFKRPNTMKQNDIDDMPPPKKRRYNAWHNVNPQSPEDNAYSSSNHQDPFQFIPPSPIIMDESPTDTAMTPNSKPQKSNTVHLVQNHSDKENQYPQRDDDGDTLMNQRNSNTVSSNTNGRRITMKVPSREKRKESMNGTPNTVNTPSSDDSSDEGGDGDIDISTNTATTTTSTAKKKSKHPQFTGKIPPNRLTPDSCSDDEDDTNTVPKVSSDSTTSIWKQNSMQNSATTTTTMTAKKSKSPPPQFGPNGTPLTPDSDSSSDDDDDTDTRTLPTVSTNNTTTPTVPISESLQKPVSTVTTSNVVNDPKPKPQPTKTVKSRGPQFGPNGTPLTPDSSSEDEDIEEETSNTNTSDDTTNSTTKSNTATSPSQPEPEPASKSNATNSNTRNKPTQFVSTPDTPDSDTSSDDDNDKINTKNDDNDDQKVAPKTSTKGTKGTKGAKKRIPRTLAEALAMRNGGSTNNTNTTNKKNSDSSNRQRNDWSSSRDYNASKSVSNSNPRNSRNGNENEVNPRNRSYSVRNDSTHCMRNDIRNNNGNCNRNDIRNSNSFGNRAPFQQNNNHRNYSGSPFGGGSKRCYNCNETGHISRECTKPRQQRQVVCYHCNETGHYKRECPNLDHPPVLRTISDSNHSNNGQNEGGRYRSYNGPNRSRGYDDNDNNNRMDYGFGRNQNQNGFNDNHQNRNGYNHRGTDHRDPRIRTQSQSPFSPRDSYRKHQPPHHTANHYGPSHDHTIRSIPSPLSQQTAAKRLDENTLVTIRILKPQITKQMLIQTLEQQHGVTVLFCGNLIPEKTNPPFNKCPLMQLGTFGEREHLITESEKGRIIIDDQIIAISRRLHRDEMSSDGSSHGSSYGSSYGGSYGSTYGISRSPYNSYHDVRDGNGYGSTQKVMTPPHDPRKRANREIQDLTKSPNSDHSAGSKQTTKRRKSTNSATSMISIDDENDDDDDDGLILSESDSVDSFCSKGDCPKSPPPPYPAEMLPDDTTDIALKMKYRHSERAHVHCIKFRVIKDIDTLSERVVQSVSTVDLVGGDVDRKRKMECDENEYKIYDTVSSDANEQIMNVDSKSLSPSIKSSNAWTITLCIEEMKTTPTAKPGDVIPMICYEVRGCTFPRQYWCDEMVRYQWKGCESTTKLVEWSDIIDSWTESELEEMSEIKEFIELKFKNPNGMRTDDELNGFKCFLKDCRGTFVDPALYDGQYLIGFKVLTTKTPLIGDAVKQNLKGILFKIKMK